MQPTLRGDKRREYLVGEKDQAEKKEEKWGREKPFNGEKRKHLEKLPMHTQRKPIHSSSQEGRERKEKEA